MIGVYPDLPQSFVVSSVWTSSVISRYASWPVSLGLKDRRHLNGGVFGKSVRSIAYFLFVRLNYVQTFLFLYITCSVSCGFEYFPGPQAVTRKASPE